MSYDKSATLLNSVKFLSSSHTAFVIALIACIVSWIILYANWYLTILARASFKPFFRLPKNPVDTLSVALTCACIPLNCCCNLVKSVLLLQFCKSATICFNSASYCAAASLFCPIHEIILLVRVDAPCIVAISAFRFFCSCEVTWYCFCKLFKEDTISLYFAIFSCGSLILLIDSIEAFNSSIWVFTLSGILIELNFASIRAISCGIVAKVFFIASNELAWVPFAISALKVWYSVLAKRK